MNDELICVLGRQSSIGIAELESLYGAENVKKFGDSAALLKADENSVNFLRIGGSIKLCRIIDRFPPIKWQELEPKFLKNLGEYTKSNSTNKLYLGLSAYGLDTSPGKLTRLGLISKNTLRKNGYSVRVIPNNELQLNSAQVIHNKLLSDKGFEFIFIKSNDEVILAQTISVQNINSYTLRDRNRPKRDARVGMLPPKLAQIIINLASPKENSLILDPFCGTGVVLQEALLMGYSVYGTDLDDRMVEYSTENLNWIKSKFDIKGSSDLETGDATSHKWQKFDSVASETYLGPPLTTLPNRANMEKFVGTCNLIIEKFLKNLADQAKPGTRICIAVPAWQTNENEFQHLPVLDRLELLGYNRVSFEHLKQEDLIYYRPDQIVGRELIVLIRK